MTDGDGDSSYCYRVAGHYGGMWDQSVWMKTLTEAEQAYRKIRQRGDWMQLSIERTDGAKKSGPDSDRWYQDTEGDDAR